MCVIVPKVALVLLHTTVTLPPIEIVVGVSVILQVGGGGVGVWAWISAAGKRRKTNKIKTDCKIRRERIFTIELYHSKNLQFDNINKMPYRILCSVLVRICVGGRVVNCNWL